MHEYVMFYAVNGSADCSNAGIGYADVVADVSVRKRNRKKKTFGIRLLL